MYVKTIAAKQKRSASARRKTQPYVHAPVNSARGVQREEIRRILRSTGVQPKLTTGQFNDESEREADRVAAQAVAMPDPRLQRQSVNEEEEKTLQTKPLARQITRLQQSRSDDSTLQRSPGPGKSASYEIDCYERETISGFSDKNLIREMTRIRTAINRGFKGYCQTEVGTIKAPWQYYRDLNIEATGRGLLTHPTGITSTTAGGNSLNYGADFTHTLDISAGGSSSDLRGSEIKEDLSIPRDDFNFNQRIKEDTWTLGKIKMASPTPGKFTDRNFTPANLVQNRCAHSFVAAIPPVRVEVQKLKWRRVSTDNWKPPFHTNKIIFKLMPDRRGRYWAVTMNNGAVHKERYFGGYLPRMKPKVKRGRRR